jgi:hypothetical protein
MEWSTNELALPFPTATSVATVATHKRPREEGVSHSDEVTVVTDTHDMPPQKRARVGTKAKVSAARTRHKPAARIPRNLNDKPKEAGRGAERLATPNAQGIYRQSLLGPSLQQGWAAEAADGQLIWVEGSMEERVDSTVQQQRQ